MMVAIARRRTSIAFFSRFFVAINRDERASFPADLILYAKSYSLAFNHSLELGVFGLSLLFKKCGSRQFCVLLFEQGPLSIFG